LGVLAWLSSCEAWHSFESHDDPPHPTPTPTPPQNNPKANASALVANRLGLLLDDESQLPDFQRAAERLRALLPGIDTDRFVEAFPAVLDADDFEAALQV